MKNWSRALGIAMVLAAMTSMQGGSVLSKAMFEHAHPFGVLFARFLFSAVLLLAIARPRLGGYDRQAWAWFAAFGVAVSGMTLAFFLALERVPVGVAVTIELSGPLVVAATQVRKVRDGLWVLLAFGGIVLIGAQSFRGALDPVGILFSVLAAVMCGLYVIASKQVGARAKGLDGLAIGIAIGTLLLIPFGAVPFAAAVAGRPVLVLPFLTIAVLANLVTFGLEMAALRRLPVGVFGVLLSLEPAIATLMAGVFLGEQLGPVEIAAVVMVMVASAGMALATRGEVAPTPAEPEPGNAAEATPSASAQ